MKFSTLLIVANSLAVATPIRILGVFPSISRSHLMCYETLMKALAARGHQVTVISSFPQNETIANYTDIAIPRSLFGLEKIVETDSGIGNIQSSLQITMHQVNLFIVLCRHFLENENIQKLIHSQDIDFDIIIVEIEISDCFLGFAHRFSNAHTIGIYAQSLSSYSLDVMGTLSPYAYVPHVHIYFSDHMTLYQRIDNAIFQVSLKVTRDLFFLPIQDALMRKYFNSSSSPPPYISTFQKKMALLLINNDALLSFPRPYLPNVIEVGGFHIQPPQKLDKDLEKYLDDATHGVVYFSLGSLLGGLHMPKAEQQVFVEAFSALKQRVIWISDQKTIHRLSSNVKLEKWLPQSDILAHPNVRVFITHGGKLSIHEAVYHGVPIVGIPFNADQFLNMQKIQKLGYGIQLKFNNITPHSLQWAVNELLYEPRYQQRAKKISAMFRDQLMTPLERAVYWTEYVHKHKGAPHLQLAATQLYWYQYIMLDAICLFLLVLGLVVFLLIHIIKRLTIKINNYKQKTLETKRITNNHAKVFVNHTSTSALW